jgi:hypothetical protein
MVASIPRIWSVLKLLGVWFQFPDSYTHENILFQMNFKHVNKLFTLIIGYYKLLKEPSYETQSYYNSQFCKRKICIECDSSGSKGTYGPVLHSYIWVAYSYRLVCPVAWAGVLLIDKKTSVKYTVIPSRCLLWITSLNLLVLILAIADVCRRT